MQPSLDFWGEQIGNIVDLRIQLGLCNEAKEGVPGDVICIGGLASEVILVI